MELYFFNPDDGHAVDSVGAAGLGHYSRKSLDELRQQYGPRVHVAPWDHVMRMIDLHACTPVRIVSDDEALHMLEVLPPVHWHHERAAESWFMSEFDSGNVTRHYVRLGRVWYRFSAPAMRQHAARVRWVEYALAEAHAVEAPHRLGVH